MLALASADWHIGDTIKGFMPYELREDIDTILDLILKEVERLSPKCFILAGDIFDTKTVGGESLAKCSRFIKRCRDVGCTVLFVQGQHDLNTVPILSTYGYDNVVYLNGKLQWFSPDGNLRIAGMDFSYKPLRAISCDLLVTHQNWKRPGWPFGIQEPIPALLKKKLVVSGDWHEHTVFHLGSDLPAVLSPGPLLPQRLTEPKTCAIWAIEDDLSYRSILIPTRKWFEYTIMGTDELDKAVSEVNGFRCDPTIPERFVKPVCVLRYPADLHNQVLKAEESMNAICIHVLLTSPKERRPMEKLTSSQFDIRQILRRLYADDPKLADIERILMASSPSAVKEIIRDILGEPKNHVNGGKVES